MSKQNSGSKASIERGLFNLAVGNTVEAAEYQDRRRAMSADGCDDSKDLGVASSGSRGIGVRQYQRWDAKEKRFRKFYYDAWAERWVEQDTRPRWQQDLEACRARLAAKGKLPKGAKQ